MTDDLNATYALCVSYTMMGSDERFRDNGDERGVR